MRMIPLTMAVLVFSGLANADCIGSDSFKTCNDNSGNSYTVKKFGNSTSVNGHNAKTGSSWNQNSQKVGNTTFTNGYDADGNSWNSTATKVGSSTFVSGTDSDGNSFSKICNQFGCN